MAEEKKGIELNDEKDNAGNEPEVLTEQQVKDAELTPEEVELAKQTGMIKQDKPEGQPPQEKKAQEKQPAAAPAQNKPEEEKAIVPKPLNIEERKKVAEVASLDLNEEEEKELLKDYNQNEKGLYYKMKREYKKRQVAVAELAEVRARAELAEAKLKAFEDMRQEPAAPTQQADDDINDEDILTGAEVKERLKKIKDRGTNAAAASQPNGTDAGQPQNIDEQRRRQQAELIQRNLLAQETVAKAKYEDFDDACRNANVIIKAVSLSFSQRATERIDGEGILEEMFGGDRTQILQAKKLSKSFAESFLNGGTNEFGETSADIAYQIGKLRDGFQAGEPEIVPQNGSAARKIGTEKVERIINNAGKQKNPENLGAAGRRFVPYGDITPEDVAKMTTEEWAALPQAVKDRLLG
jgi:protein tyrosine phosphatase (PTP) superfamily phosphohydrolase (DUF442 family)